ncbi:PQQ-binding-like beta-propeller repeat protein [Candidatus Latescibacterota bacterium]
MRFVLTIVVVIMLLSTSLFAQDNLAEYNNNWPQWRGPLTTGGAPSGNPPTEWSETKNIRWKTELPGTGYATPVIWGNDIFISAAIGPENYKAPGRGQSPSQPVKFIVMAVDRTNGKVKWESLAREAVPHEGMHESTTWATSSPMTDGKHVWAYFGSQGLYCYTIDGDLVWKKDFGDQTILMAFGEGSTPALYKDRIIVNWDHEGESFIVALDALTGEEIWRKERDEKTTWMTPLIVEDNGRTHVITTALNRVLSYDLETGEILWEDEGMTANAIPSPIAKDGIAYLMSGFRGAALRAVKLSEAKGTITGTPAVLWQYNQDTSYVPSALLHDGAFYFLRNNDGTITSLDIKTGKPYYSNQRIEGMGTVYASPVGVADRIYLPGRDGTSVVLKHGSEFGIIATNKLDDKIDASPVIMGDELYLRGHKYLYCIAE